MTDQIVEVLRFGVGANEKLVEILKALRTSGILLESFYKEYAASIGSDRVQEIKKMKKELSRMIKKMNEMGDEIDSRCTEIAAEKKKVPMYNMQLFRNEFITHRTDKHTYLRFPEESGYAAWNVKLSNRFVTVYDSGFAEWRYYPKSTKVSLYKYDENGNKKLKQISGEGFADLLGNCNKIAEFTSSKNQNEYSLECFETMR